MQHPFGAALSRCHRAGCMHPAAPAAAAVAVHEVPTGQLSSLAAAHPEAYTALIDCFLRVPVMEAAAMVAAGHVMQLAVAAVLDSDAVMANTIAVASLASAITSLVKRAVQFVRDPCGMQQKRQQLAAEQAQLAAACYPAAGWALVRFGLGPISRGGSWAAKRITQTAIPSNSSSSSSSTSQAAASAALLAVVLARSLVQLADAMEAAGPQLLFRCQQPKPAFHLKWVPGGQVHVKALGAAVPPGNAPQQTMESQWQFWQLGVLSALQPLMSAMAMLGMSRQGGDAEDTAAAAAAPDVTASSSSSGQATYASSSSSNGRPKWGHLLQLQQFSPDWATAVEGFSTKRPRWREDVEDGLACLLSGVPILGGTPIMTMVGEVPLLFGDALQLTRELVDAAPLPVVCNNPRCGSLAGVSEAAAACKACAVCMCRYCSVACQRADWKQHKLACRRMAAAGMTCG
jgi:hypothetical protein